jgi:hypothetical protein
MSQSHHTSLSLLFANRAIVIKHFGQIDYFNLKAIALVTEGSFHTNLLFKDKRANFTTLHYLCNLQTGP